MADNRISATLSPSDADAVLAAIATIKQHLPFLISLTPDERRALPKGGDRSRTFIQKALDIANQNPGILAVNFSLDEMRKDVALLQALQPIVLAITQISELIVDTEITVGSEAYAAALSVYSYAKTSGQGQALNEALDELGKRFARKTNGKAPSPAKVSPEK